MTIIAAVQAYVKTFTGLETGSPVWVNSLGPKAVEYSVVPLPGERVLETYINGTKIMSFPFAFQSVTVTMDDAARLEAQGFFEDFCSWMDAQTEAGILPTLDGGATALSIRADSWGFLFEQGESGTGVHQVTCELLYEQP